MALDVDRVFRNITVLEPCIIEMETLISFYEIILCGMFRYPSHNSNLLRRRI